jgi:hypothetical protein
MTVESSCVTIEGFIAGIMLMDRTRDFSARANPAGHRAVYRAPQVPRQVAGSSPAMTVAP